MTDIAYEKGAAFLQTVESVVGRQRLDAFLRDYFLPDTIPAGRLSELDSTFRLSSSGNSEILFAWLEIAIRNRYQPAFAALERFLSSQGRRKFVRPLFAELAKSDWGREMALRIYRRTRPTYHSVTSTSVDQIPNWPAAQSAPAAR